MTPQQHGDLYRALKEFTHRFGSMQDNAIAELPAHTTVSITLQARGDTDADTIRAIDVLAWDVLDERAQTRQMDSIHWHHNAHGNIGPVHVSVFAPVASPETNAKDAEIAALKAEVEQLRQAREPVDA